MKCVGLIGGMSWESSLEYYRLLNEGVKKRLGGLHSARVLMYSLDFDEIEGYMSRGRWDLAGAALAEAAGRLERGGADFFLICTNTLHKTAEAVRTAVGIPLVHIGEATARAVKELALGKVGLLGTKFTMEEDFLTGYLKDRHGIETLIPGQADRLRIHDIIFKELCLGDFRPESREVFVEIMQGLAASGAEGVILGCTEIPLLVSPEQAPLPLIDTTAVHAAMAVELALEG